MTTSLQNYRTSSRNTFSFLVLLVLLIVNPLLGPIEVQASVKGNGSGVFIPHHQAAWPTPSTLQPRFAGQPSGQLSKADLLRHKKLELTSEIPADKKGWQVQQFECTVLIKGQDAMSFQCQGSKLPKALLTKFQEMKSGDSVYFDDIRVTQTGASEGVNLGGLAYKIVE